MAASTMALLLAAALIPVSHANEPIAYWTSPRAAFVRDVIYIEGGDMFVGDVAAPTRILPGGGSVYNISLCDAFTTAVDTSDPYPYLHKVDVTGTEVTPPFYVAGAMFATDDVFYTYGGMESKNDTSNNGVTYGSIFQSYPDQGWQWGVSGGWSQGDLYPTTRYFTSGSWTSAPSENLGFWFSGLRAENYTDVHYNTNEGDPDQPRIPATDFLIADLSGTDTPTIQNMSWPADVKPRAEGALIWLPYGIQGMLLAFGGIEIPSDLSVTGLLPTYNSTNGTNNYMTSILVYDVYSKTWEMQQTAGTFSPPQTASFCTVVATESNNNSHHIYVYGGYDGTYDNPTAYDTVWVLSIPAFVWTKISEGVPTKHRRQNHVCVNMNANTMLSIGGNMEYGLALNSTAFDVYDLSTTTWTGKYTPDANATYTVPAAVASNVGDVASIPADLNDNVKKWLSAPPYNKPITGPILASCPTPPRHHDTWKTPVAAAVASVGGVAIIASAIWFCCIRNRRRGNRGDDTKRNSILSWVNRSGAHPTAPKSMPDSENTVIASPSDYFGVKGGQVEAYEMPSNVTSPGYNYSYSHGSPQIVAGGSATSPFMGSAEVDAQSRHEIMDHVPRAESSFGPNPYSMHSSSARNNTMSVRSDTVSHASEAVMHSRHYGYVSPYELAHDRSRDDLAAPPTDLSLSEPRSEQLKNASTHSLGVEAEKVSSPAVMTPIAPITRTIDGAGSGEETEVDRPRHKRNQSSMSSNLPNLPSPGPEEDRRRSKLLETLPDPISGQSSPVQPQTVKKSAYTEDLDA